MKTKNQTTRPMTKSVLRLAREAVEVAREAMPARSNMHSPKIYTQHSLFGALAVREFLGLDYRGLEQILREWPQLRETLGLARVPDHSTFQKAAERLLTKKGGATSWRPPCASRAIAAWRRAAPSSPWTRPATRPAASAPTM